MNWPIIPPILAMTPVNALAVPLNSGTDTSEYIANMFPDEMIHTVAVSHGIGGSAISVHPQRAVSSIRKGVEAALSRDLSSARMDLPPHLRMEVRFRDHMDAYIASFFPGVMSVDPHTVLFESDDYFELLRVLMFTV